MKAFYISVMVAHVLAVVLLVSVMPRQLRDISRERDSRHRKVCWILFLGTLSLALSNTLAILHPIFDGTGSEVFFDNLVSLFNAVVAITLALLGQVFQHSTSKTLPQMVDEIEHQS